MVDCLQSENLEIVFPRLAFPMTFLCDVWVKSNGHDRHVEGMTCLGDSYALPRPHIMKNPWEAHLWKKCPTCANFDAWKVVREIEPKSKNRKGAATNAWKMQCLGCRQNHSWLKKEFTELLMFFWPGWREPFVGGVKTQDFELCSPFCATEPKIQNSQNRSKTGLQGIQRNRGSSRKMLDLLYFDLLYPQFIWRAWNPVFTYFNFRPRSTKRDTQVLRLLGLIAVAFSDGCRRVHSPLHVSRMRNICVHIFW